MIENQSPVNPKLIAEAQLQENDLGAWLLPISVNEYAAVGRYELKYIEYVNDCVTLPGVPAFFEQGFMWRDRFIPALDVQSLVTRRRAHQASGEQMVAIIAFENRNQEIDLGAILLRGVPKLIKVLPEQSSDVAELAREWRLITQAAFKNEQGTMFKNEQGTMAKNEQAIIPVLDLRSLFDRTPADLLSLH